MKPFIYDMNFVREQSSKKLFNFISTFAGGGGSSTGYRLAGGHALGVNEFIPEAQRAYQKNYPDTKIFPGDIRELTVEMILNECELNPGQLDLFDGSPPCASFSLAGKREKMWGKVKKYSDSSQRTDDLFFEYARILEGLQPKTFVAENVKGITVGKAMGLLGNGQMSIWDEEEKTIYATLVKAGYRVKYQVLNAADYGVPQARERTIFIGIRNDIPGDIIFPKKFSRHISASEAIEDLGHTVDQTLYINDTAEMTLKLWQESRVGDGFDIKAKEIYKKVGWFNYMRIHPDEPCPTILSEPKLFHWSEPRFFSVPELIRFCSFPEDYYLGDKFSKQVERLGRAVPPLMMKAIAESVYKNVLEPLRNFNPLELTVNDLI